MGLRLVAVIFGVFTFVYVGSGQVNSRLSGSVVDPSGLAVPSATVDLLLPGGAKPVISSVTTAEGLFAFTSVPVGTYNIVVSAAGFRKFTEREVVLTAGTETSLPAFHLEIGSTTEVVEVTESKETVQTTNAEIATNIGRQQVQDLPILNRSPQGFVDTQAGVTLGRGGDSVINGQRTSFTNVTLDGINIQDNYIRTNAVDFSPNLLLLDQVAEMTISTSNTNPSAGAGSSQVIFVTPSGTNSFHGSGFWSNRNSALAANTWFNNQAGVAKPFLNQNQTGGRLGGPIKKDKLFFYANYELFLLKQQSAQQRTILTSDAAQGIFTYIGAGGAVNKVNILQATGQTIDPTVQALISRIPGPSAINNFNSGDSTASLLHNSAGYLFNQRNNRTRNNVTGKIDYMLSPRNTISGTYAWNSDLLDRPDVNTTGYSVVPLVNNNDKVNFLSTAWRYSPKANLTNEVRFGFNFAPALFISSENFGNSILGVPATPTAPTTIFSTPVAVFRSQGRYTDTYNYADNASWVHGAHNIQFGFQLQRDYSNPYNDVGITPTYNLGISSANPIGLTNQQLPGASSADLTTANNLLATLAGFLTSYTQTFNVKSQTSGYVNGQTQSRNWRFDDYSAYILDNWKVDRRLTLSIGLRYEYYSPVVEQNGLVLLPQLVNNNPLTTLLSNATLNFSSGAGLYRPDRNNFGPNIGLAWDVTGNGKTAVRAGYSVNYVNDEYLTALTGNANTNAGLAQTVTNPTALTSQIRNGLPTIATPNFLVPRTFLDNYNLSPTTNFGMSDPNLRSPYVQQWNIGIQHEMKGVVFEARYVGNHGTKLLRALDFNQININAGGFLADFQRAQQNGNLSLATSGIFNPAYDPNIPGSQVLTVFPQMPNGGNLTNATNRTYIQQGAVADMAFNYQSTKANGPINFMPNPYAASLRLMTNYSNSTYNGLQLEMRSREWRGLTFQGNYTFSKVLSDAGSGSDNNNQSRYEPLMDNNNPGLDKSRALFDLTHVMKFNYVYRLPIGDGHWFSVKPLNHYVLNGWLMSGIFDRQSGEPFSICSGIGTFNRNNNLATNSCNTVDTTLNLSQLQSALSYQMTGNGPYMVTPSALNRSGQAAVAGGTPFSGQLFVTPPAGTIGTLQKRILSGPWDTTFDFGLSKTTKIKERHEIQLRMDATNFFNHPSFVIGDQTVTASTFGKITTTFAARRQMQFTLLYRF
jgi:hypothetical protein